MPHVMEKVMAVANSTNVTRDAVTSLRTSDHQNTVTLYFTTIVVAMFFLWLLCCYVNGIVLHKTEQFCSSKTQQIKQITTFVATVDILFSTTFLLYYLVHLIRELLLSNEQMTQNKICYDIRGGISDWLLNVALTAGLVAMLRQSLLGMLSVSSPTQHQRPARSLSSRLFTVSTWWNPWTLALLALLLATPWLATSAVLRRLPQVGSGWEVCFVSAPMWTLIIPVSVSVTFVSTLLASGRHVHATHLMIRLTAPMYCRRHRDLPAIVTNNRNYGYRATNKSSENNLRNAVTTEHEYLSICHQMVLVFIILVAVAIFVVACLYGNVYSDVTQLLRAEVAITLTSLFQTLIFYHGRDLPREAGSSKVLSITSGDVIIT